MNKSINTLLLALLLISLAACNGTGKDITKMIPNDVAFAMQVDATSIRDNDDSLSNLSKQLNLSNSTDSTNRLATCELFISNSTDVDKLYTFAPLNVFAVVSVANMSDIDNWKKEAVDKFGSDFVKADAFQYIAKGNFIVAHDSDVALVAQLSERHVSIDKALEEIGKYFTSEQGINTNEKVMKHLTSDNQFNAVCNVNTMLAVPSLNLSQSQRDKLRLFDQLGFEYVALDGNFDKQNFNFKINIEMKGNESTFKDVAAQLTKAPSAEFLKVVPNSLHSVFAISTDGGKLAKIPLIKQTIMTSSLALSFYRIDLFNLFKAIEGTISVAFSRDTIDSENFNCVIGIETNDTEGTINAISSYFLMAMHQGKEFMDGEYIYAINNQQVKVGVIDKMVYIKMLSYESFEDNLYEDTDIRSSFERSPICFTHNDDNNQFNLMIEYNTEAGNFDGSYKLYNENSNALVEILQLLAGSKEYSF